jgi:zinc protease
MKNHLPGPDDIMRTELPNGMVILSRADFNSPSVVISGYLNCGALFDPDEKLGLADFVAAGLMHGTQRRDFQAIYDTLESVGASLGFGSGTHTTSFGGKALVEELDMLLGLFGEILRMPTFPDEQIERLRARLMTALAIRAQDPGDMASLAFDQIAYAGHPYSRPEDGYPETIQAIQKADLVEFHRQHYGPKGMVLAIAGGIDPAQAIDKATQALGDWENAGQPLPPPLPPVTPLDEAVTRQVAIPGKYETSILIGAPGPSRLSPDYLAASVGNNIFGQFGMMGRLGDSLREKAGLAYSVSSSLGGGPGPGPWDVEAGVNPRNAQQAIDLICEETRRFTHEPVSADELADSKANYIGRLPISLESNAGVASALTALERYQLGLDYYRRYPDLVRLITAEEILAAARRYLDVDRLAIAVAGP